MLVSFLLFHKTYPGVQQEAREDPKLNLIIDFQEEGVLPKGKRRGHNITW